MTESERKKLTDLLRTDKTLAQVAKDMGYSYHTLRIRVAEAGLEISRVLVDKMPVEAK